MPKPRRYWTDETIKQAIMDVVNTLSINHMPTRNEIRDFYGDDALTNRVSKTYGYYGWAKIIGLPVKQNDTLKGKTSEKAATEILSSHGYEVIQMSQNYPYDLLINSAVKIDVKFSNLYHGQHGHFYSFALRKKYPTCDVYMMIANADDGEKKVYILPSKDVSQIQIAIGENSSIYEKYRDRYDIIDQYLKLYSEIA